MNPPERDEKLNAIRDLNAVFAEVAHPVVIVGGVAASLLAVERSTRDVDALVVFDVANVDHLIATLEAHGFPALFPGMGQFARGARLVVVNHQRTGITVDIALGCMPFESELVGRSQVYRYEEVEVRLPTPEDLLILKAIANRSKDREDIRNLAQTYPNLDRKRVRYWVEEYAGLLETPQLWAEIEPLLDSQD